MPEPKQSKLALVLSGGGARGAYEAGVLHYIRTMLPPEISKKRRFDILCGSSVGALNVCYLAAAAHDLTYQGNRIYQAWKHLRQENVYKRDVKSLAKLIYGGVAGISRNIFGSSHDEDLPFKKKHFNSFFNTAPMVPYLKNNIPWKQISLNIKNELIQAVSVTATNIATGNVELFIEKHPSVKYTGRYMMHDTKLEYYHAMASAALPMLFPSVQINNQHFMDGGLRLNTPMSPAIQLGAEKILVIGLHYRGERADTQSEPSITPFLEPAEPPSMGMMLGKILSSIFLDKLDYDIEQMDRINRIIEWGRACYGEDFVQRINQHLNQNNVTGDIATRGLKELKAMSIFPSRDLRKVFTECVEGTSFFTKGMTLFERTLLKILDVDLYTSKDFLSFIMFVPEYLNRLLELGFEDARSRHDELVEFMGGD
jgi:NTE family protein